MTPPIQDSALTALERARTAQERFERRIDVQLRIPADVLVREDVPTFREGPGNLNATCNRCGAILPGLSRLSHDCRLP